MVGARSSMRWSAETVDTLPEQQAAPPSRQCLPIAREIRRKKKRTGTNQWDGG
jgi:hypothetical protein